jgi:hypothetical protein
MLTSFYRDTSSQRDVSCVIKNAQHRVLSRSRDTEIRDASISDIERPWLDVDPSVQLKDISLQRPPRGF